MAEGTRLKDLDARINKMFEMFELARKDNAEKMEIIRHDSIDRLERIEHSISAMQSAIVDLQQQQDCQHKQAITNGLMLQRASQSSNPHMQRNFQKPRSVKLDFPRFNGEGALQWIFRAEQFFPYHDTPDDERLIIAAVHMEGKIIPWFQLLMRSNQLPTWKSLTDAIQLQYGPSQFESARASLFKLTQTSSVNEYYSAFTELANRVDDLSEASLLDCFISGLVVDLRREVIVQTPSNLTRAVALTKLFEESTEYTLGNYTPGHSLHLLYLNIILHPMRRFLLPVPCLSFSRFIPC